MKLFDYSGGRVVQIEQGEFYPSAVVYNLKKNEWGKPCAKCEYLWDDIGMQRIQTRIEKIEVGDVSKRVRMDAGGEMVRARLHVNFV
jgi:hypothetical protein